MKIKEKDEQHMVIVSSLSQRLGWILLLAFAIFMGFIGFPSLSVAPIVISVVFGICALANLRSRKVVIDKLTQSISLDERRFLLIYRQRIIPFSAVKGMTMDEKIRTNPQGGIPHKAWEISIDIGGKKLKIDKGSNRMNMLELAEKISLFMEKKLTRSYVGGSVDPFLRRD